MRHKLPSRRACYTTEVRLDGHDVFVTIGLYDDGRPGEVFLDVSRWGSQLRTWAHGTAILVSTLLQYGSSASEVVEILRGIDDPFVACVADMLHKDFCQPKEGSDGVVSKEEESQGGRVEPDPA